MLTLSDELITELNKSQQMKEELHDTNLKEDGDEGATFATELDMSTWDISQRSRASASTLGTSIRSDATAKDAAAAAAAIGVSFDPSALIVGRSSWSSSHQQHQQRHRRRRGTMQRQRSRTSSQMIITMQMQMQQMDTLGESLQDASSHSQMGGSSSYHHYDATMGSSSSRRNSNSNSNTMTASHNRRTGFRRRTSQTGGGSFNNDNNDEMGSSSHSRRSSTTTRRLINRRMSGSFKRQGSQGPRLGRNSSNRQLYDGNNNDSTTIGTTSFHEESSHHDNDDDEMGNSSCYHYYDAMGSSSHQKLNQRASFCCRGGSNHNHNNKNNNSDTTLGLSTSHDDDGDDDDDEMEMDKAIDSTMGTSSFHSGSHRRCSFQPLNSSFNWDGEADKEGDMAYLDLSVRPNTCAKASLRRGGTRPGVPRRKSSSNAMEILIDPTTTTLSNFAQEKVVELKEKGLANFVQARMGTFKRNIDTIGSVLKVTTTK